MKLAPSTLTNGTPCQNFVSHFNGTLEALLNQSLIMWLDVKPKLIILLSVKTIQTHVYFYVSHMKKGIKGKLKCEHDSLYFKK